VNTELNDEVSFGFESRSDSKTGFQIDIDQSIKLFAFFWLLASDSETTTSYVIDGICDIEKKCCEIKNLGKFQVLFQLSIKGGNLMLFIITVAELSLIRLCF
jgi:hypothetical protein